MSEVKVSELLAATDDCKKELNSLSSTQLNAIDEVISSLTTDADEALKDGNEEVAMVIERLENSVRSLGIKCKEAEKNVSKSVSSLSSEFEKLVLPSIEDRSIPQMDSAYGEEDADSVFLAIAEHLLREGEFSVAESLLVERNMESSLSSIFNEIHTILSALRVDDLIPALSWCEAHRSHLMDTKSDLEFRLHRYAFLRILEKSDAVSALRYLRDYIPRLVQEGVAKVESIYSLVGRLVSKSSSGRCDSDIERDVLVQNFVKNCCTAHGLSRLSPLATAVEAGIVALPKILNVMKFVGTESLSDVPVELSSLKPEHRFHTLLICPVSKELTNDTDNVPVMLTCGHVIAAKTVSNLSTRVSRVKCPICPSESSVGECLRLNLG